ncbi:peroxiredoxin family protein [Pseudoflavitalea rhizosphaerae]|uniref:peroxiredoxin family protein n=1 Tax=Pseudoflavitalea rhizosphaerae TaxID=1884793 RepID=UPI000F8C3BCB|nr:TlpA disulfide reductase family protein [Pseudoflavitalea rhizosphaerae]
MLKSWLMILLLSTGSVMAAGKGKYCTLEGEIKMLKAPAEVMVIQRTGEFESDSITAAAVNVNGHFKVKIPAQYNGFVLEIRVKGTHDFCNFIAEPGTVHIAGLSGKFYLATVEGSTENKRWNEYQMFQQKLSKQQNSIFQKTGLSDEERTQLFEDLNTSQKHFTDSFIVANRSSVVALYMARVPLPMMKHYQIDTVLQQFDKKLHGHPYYKEMKARADVLRRVAPGAVAPDFKVVTQDGKTPIQLSSFRGKYVLLDFWASWCVPCREENKHTLAIYKKFHPKGLEIISFSLDHELPAWQKAIEKDGILWNNASDLTGGKRSKVAQEYGIDGLPAIWLIGPDGKIIAESIRGEELEKMLESIFRK